MAHYGHRGAHISGDLAMKEIGCWKLETGIVYGVDSKGKMRKFLCDPKELAKYAKKSRRVDNRMFLMSGGDLFECQKFAVRGLPKRPRRQSAGSPS